MFGSIAGGLLGAGGIGLGAGAPAMLGATAMAGNSLFNNYLGWKNYQLQQDQYGYQKDLQQQMFAREDNSILRRTADLRSAGLSPVLAAGQGASAGAIVKTDVPQIDKMQNAGLEAMSLLKMASDISTTLSQRELIENQSRLTNANARYAEKDADTYTKDPGVDVRRASGWTKDLKDIFNLVTNDNVKNTTKSIIDKTDWRKILFYMQPESVNKKDRNKQHDKLENSRDPRR